MEAVVEVMRSKELPLDASASVCGLAHDMALERRAGTIGSATGLFYAFALFTMYLPPLFPTLLRTTGAGFWGGLARVFHTLLSFLVALVVAVLGVVSLTFFTSLFTAPFNDLLSEEVEKLVTGKPGVPFSFKAMVKGTVRGLGIELAKMLVYVFVMGTLFVLSLFVPAVGQIVYTVVGFVLSAIFFSVDYIDWPASRRDKGLRYRVGMLRRHFWPMLGFGTGVWLFLFVPFVNLLFVPAAVAGGTLLFLDLEGEKPET